MLRLADIPAASGALQRLRPQWRLADVRDVEHLAGGYSNDNYALSYRDAGYVLRVVRPTATPVDRAFERRLLTGPIALLTAPLIAYTLPDGHMLTRRVAGPLLIDTEPSSDDLARYLARLHQRIPPLGRRYDVVQIIGRDLNTAAERGEPTPPMIAKAYTNLPTPAARQTPCHNDLNPWNVIVSAADPVRWCTIDWEFAGDNDPLFDLMCTAGGLGWDIEQIDALIDAYQEYSESSRSPTTTQRRALWRAYLLREYAWALVQRACGNERNEIGEQLSRSGAALAELMA
jgi:aminoglycoside phosphotransferase (APT) family kinase protein